ncbi:PREDICTED: WD repeat-containing protein 24-like [Amphimedon queenslandica]|uniref:GATOR2 complex protein WDR24 n=1 Tax=Amphimedon queenslandica TaxID=400682 RepID=A0AAN0J9A8_AMPQE|nr:PREDICTED: WD repeat-containing protein 24-like [Amphimedon queenslandica]|eukprot:XP_019853625.1 PREDICTED: WD repeat-containing protein 24-like [Amphimedon queenslandica]
MSSLIMRRGGGPQLNQKVTINLSSPANTICANKDGTRVAVAGRKIFIICDTTDQLKEVCNLRNLPQKQLNLNFSSNHVQWNPRDENQLATAPTNSAVVLWDLNKRTKSKLNHVYEEVHQRAVNRVCYHPRDANVLLSASQDCTIVCFDTRQKTVTSRYSGAESVRDVQYNHHNDHLFAACYESGVCQIWDRRHTDHALKTINAHSGPAYSCAWHLEQEHRIVSAGRDKMMKVYDTQTAQQRTKESYSVNALYSVARVRWRPQNRNHLSRLLCGALASLLLQLFLHAYSYFP